MALSVLGPHCIREQTKIVILTLFACLGILYLTPKVIVLSIGPQDYFDFQALWLAGKIWVSGHNPYDGASFPTEYYSASDLARSSPWFYPPYWYPLIVPFGLLPFQTALGIWKVINFSLLIAGNHLIARALADVARQRYLPIFLAGTGFVCLTYSAAVTAAIGQTSFLVYFGLSAMVFGLLKARPLVLIVGLVVLALKPQIGAMAFVAVAALHRYRWTTLPAGAICLLGSTAIAITGNYRESVEGFLTNLARHSEHSANTPPHLTGLIHILDSVFSISHVSIITLIVFLVGITCVAFVFYNSPLSKTPEIEDAQQTVSTLALFVAISFFFVPLHYYDLIALVALLMMIIAVPLTGRWFIVLGLLICFRPDYLLRLFGIGNAPEIQVSHVVSAGLFLIFVGAIWSILVGRSRAIPNSATIQLPERTAQCVDNN
jgi:hypothetical protein